MTNSKHPHTTHDAPAHDAPGAELEPLEASTYFTVHFGGQAKAYNEGDPFDVVPTTAEESAAIETLRAMNYLRRRAVPPAAAKDGAKPAKAGHPVKPMTTDDLR